MWVGVWGTSALCRRPENLNWSSHLGKNCLSIYKYLKNNFFLQLVSPKNLADLKFNFTIILHFLWALIRSNTKYMWPVQND